MSASGQESVAAKTRRIRNYAERIRNYRVAVFSLLFFFFGLLALIIAWPHLRPSEYQVQGDRLIPKDRTEWPAVARDLGLAAMAVGGVGAIYEILSRQAMEDATSQRFRENVDSFSTKAAADVIARLVGDKRFVDVLAPTRRQEIIRDIILAYSDPTAEDLAARTAPQLSSRRPIRNYSACYFAKDRGEPPHAAFEQSLITEHQPDRRFQLVFQVIEPHDKSRREYESNPDVFRWRHGLAPTQSAREVLDSFRVESIKVEGVDLENIREVGRDENSVRFEGDYTPIDSRSYRIDTVLHLPEPYEGSYVYIEPGVLCRGITIQCDVELSQFNAQTVETLHADNVRIQTHRDRERRITLTTVSTDAWVLPTAAVAFVFYTPTKTYNLPPGQPNGVASNVT